MNSNKRIDLICRLILLFFIFVTIYPVFFVVITAFKSTQEFYTNIWFLPRQIAWANFPKAWITAHIGEYTLHSVIVVVSTVVGNLIVSTMAGYALSRLYVPFAKTILFLIIFVLMLPSEFTIMPLYLSMAKWKLLDSHLTLIIPYIGWGLPMAIYIFKNFFDTIPNELIEAGRIDGASETRTFVQIVVPLMLPALGTVSIFSFVGAWGELLCAQIALGTTSKIRTIPMGIVAFQQQFSVDWGPLSASICIVLIPLVVVFLFLQKYFIRGLTGGSIK